MQYTKQNVARLIDISAVKTESSIDDVNNVIATAKKYNLVCLFTMPSFVDYARESIIGYDTVGLGGVVGFPSGAETTEAKLFQANELKAKGCTEIDMVMNIGKLKSGMYDEIRHEIEQLRDAVSPLPLKVIIEVALLSNDEIVKASQIVRDAGAAFVKTGTGWAGNTTLDHVKLIKDTVGDTIELKVAGGVRDFKTLQTMYEMGVTRFGIGYGAVVDILEGLSDE